ncbi:MAG TPA: metallophosphoesterase [Pseudonocardia sp.]|nr:metallophosphoesterase [Pseudonocardia sp.]
MIGAVTILLIAAGTVVLLHLYLYGRLVHSPAGRVRWRVLGAFILLLLAATTVAAAGLQRFLPARYAVRVTTTDWAVLSWVGYLWLALALYLALVLVVVEVPRLLVRGRMDPARRRVLARILGGAALLVAGGTVGYGVREARTPQLVRRDVPLDRLDPKLDGVTIAVLSDIHLGTINRGPFLADIVRRVNDETPDMVAVVGDLIDGSVADLGAQAAPLRNLVGPTFFVTGNHEYFYDAEQWCEFLPTLGVRVLRNERVEVGRWGAGAGAPTFDLAGIDDRTAARSGEPGHGANLTKALAGRDPARTVVLLAHQPVMVDQSSKAGVDLQISGHTHGGQFLPFGYLVLLDQPVLAGLTRVGRTWLYVTRGVGFWGPPVRVGAPPEITLLTLRAPTQPAPPNPPASR